MGLYIFVEVSGGGGGVVNGGAYNRHRVCRGGHVEGVKQ